MGATCTSMQSSNIKALLFAIVFVFVDLEELQAMLPSMDASQTNHASAIKATAYTEEEATIRL